jgi:hypothetical protein
MSDTLTTSSDIESELDGCDFQVDFAGKFGFSKEALEYEVPSLISVNIHSSRFSAFSQFSILLALILLFAPLVPLILSHFF